VCSNKQREVLKLANVKLGETQPKRYMQDGKIVMLNKGKGNNDDALDEEDNKQRNRKEITLRALSYEFVPPCVWVKHDGTMDAVILNTLSMRCYYLLTRSPGMRAKDI